MIALHSLDGNLQTGPPLSPPEKRAAKLAFWLQQDTLSESGLSAKHAELRGFSAIFRGKPQGFSAVETCWRRTQSRANPSPPRFPANREKYREFRELARPLVAVSGPKRFIFRNFCCQSRVLALNRTGNYEGRIRQFTAAYQEIRHHVSQRHLHATVPKSSGLAPNEMVVTAGSR